MDDTSEIRSATSRAAPTAKRAPGPKGIPFFGSAFPAWRDPLGLMIGARKTYGDVVRFKFGPFA